MGKIYVTSDLHLCHDKEFLYEKRGFTNIWDMNTAILQNWNNIVNPEDDVYLLGDVMLNNNKIGLNILKNLKGKIHIICGNHDTAARIESYKNCWNVVEVCYGLPLKYKKWHFFLSHYPTLTANMDDGKAIQQHIINLCGHSHTQDRWADWEKGTIYHVELDAHNNTPVLIDDIIEDLKNKER